MIFERLAYLGHSVYVVSGCTSDSEIGYKHSLGIWNKSFDSKKSKVRHRFITRFNENKVNYSLIRTRRCERMFLCADEQENIYRESLSVIKKQKINIIIGYGNLLLEESILIAARANKTKILFYLVNPSYKGKRTFLTLYSDLVLTDSNATKELYKDNINCKFEILPKLIELSKKHSSHKEQDFREFNCLFVNPSIHKGLEPFLMIAKKSSINYPQIRFICIASQNKFDEGLKILGYDKVNLPSNIILREPTSNQDILFKKINIVLLLSLWHESGSRLIYESYSRGIPVIGFNTGGTSEFIKSHEIDIFDKPLTCIDENNNLRIKSWNSNELLNRIVSLSKDYKSFKAYSQSIKKYYEGLDLNNKFDNQIKNIIDELNVL